MMARKSFKEFVIEVANMESDNYSELGNLPEEARQLLLAIPPELDPWHLLNQAQEEQMRLEKEIQTLRQSLKERDSVILKAKELIEDYEYSLWEQDDIVERNVCPDCGNPEDEEHEADCKFDEVLKAIESLKSPHDGKETR